MKLSEKNSYALAVIIVLSGTLIIALGFTIGLLSMMGGSGGVDDKAEKKTSADMQAEIMDGLLSGDDLLIDDYIISMDFFLSDDELDPSPDSDAETPRRRRPPTSADRSVRRGKWIHIDKSDFTLVLYNGDTAEREWKIAVGIVPGDKQRRGDNRTPNGVFRIRQIQDASRWTHDFGDGNGVIEGAYGPWFIRLYTPPWTGIGIHGTHDPDSIESRASEGCIRMSNEDVSELKNLVSLGMPVVVEE